MSAPYESTGRTAQKSRTRAALVAAVRGLLADGAAPTVDAAAERAGVSRATAYRYFPDQRALVLAAYPELGASTLLDDTAPTDVEERLATVLDRVIASVLDHEPELRAGLRLSLETTPGARRGSPVRTGLALGWFEEALAPLRDRLPKAEVHRLALAIRATCGIEPLVWLTDIGGLSRPDAAELMRESALTLLLAKLAAEPLSRPRRAAAAPAP